MASNNTYNEMLYHVPLAYRDGVTKEARETYQEVRSPALKDLFTLLNESNLDWPTRRHTLLRICLYRVHRTITNPP